VQGYVAFAVLISFFICVVHCTWHLWLTSVDHDESAGGDTSELDDNRREKGAGASFTWTWKDEKGIKSRNWSNIIECVSFTFIWLTVTAVTFRPNLPWGNNGNTGGKFWESFGDGLLLSIMEFQWASAELKRRAFHIGFWVSILIAALMPKLGLGPLARAKKTPVLAKEKRLAYWVRYIPANADRMKRHMEVVERVWPTEAGRQARRGKINQWGNLVWNHYETDENSVLALADYDEYKWRFDNVDKMTRELAALQAEVRKTKDGVRSDTAKLTEVLSTGIYMVVVKQIMAGFSCTHNEGGVATLDLDPSMVCYEGRHWAYMLFGAIAFLVYYPMAVLTKPFYQAMDAKLEINYDRTFMFLLLQLETALAVAVVFFPRQPDVALPLTLVVDCVLVWWYFAHPPCTVSAFNEAARALFSFSACATASSMVAHFAGNDFIASLLLFMCTFVIMVVALSKWFIKRKKAKKAAASIKEEDTTNNPMQQGLQEKGPGGVQRGTVKAVI
jgi:hypothetical protein